MLVCPKCRKALNRAGASYKCSEGHSYDIASSGYVNLLLPNMVRSSSPGDGKETVRARHRFLSAGHYAPLAAAIVDIAGKYLSKDACVADIGCGEGYFVRSLVSSCAVSCTGIDISKNALAVASAQDKTSLYVVASGKELPFSDESCDAVMSIMAPLYNNEAIRILQREGILIKVTPGKKHLYELKRIIYDNPYYNEETLRTPENTFLCEDRTVDFTMSLREEEIRDLFCMTPYYFRTPGENRERLADIPFLEVNADFNLAVYMPMKRQ